LDSFPQNSQKFLFINVIHVQAYRDYSSLNKINVFVGNAAADDDGGAGSFMYSLYLWVTKLLLMREGQVASCVYSMYLWVTQLLLMREGQVAVCTVCTCG
jgi:hypothetical protein